MKPSFLLAVSLTAFVCTLANWDKPSSHGNQTAIVVEPIKTIHMKMNMGIITDRLKETRAFYTEKLDFKVVYEADWFLLLSTPDGSQQISFLQPNHPSQQPLFQEAFAGRGVYLTIEVDDVDAVCQLIQSKKIPLAISLRDEPWGDRHFAVVDPNGIGIDFVKYTAPEN